MFLFSAIDEIVKEEKITTQIISQIYANISHKNKAKHKHKTTKNNEIKFVVVCLFFFRCKMQFYAPEHKKTREHIHTKKRTVQHRLCFILFIFLFSLLFMICY